MVETKESHFETALSSHFIPLGRLFFLFCPSFILFALLPSRTTPRQPRFSISMFTPVSMLYISPYSAALLSATVHGAQAI
jgi:hypothetical protein